MEKNESLDYVTSSKGHSKPCDWKLGKDRGKAGYDEAIMPNKNNVVAEATSKNIIRIIDGILSTSPASDCALRRIAGYNVIHIAGAIGMLVRRNTVARGPIFFG